MKNLNHILVIDIETVSQHVGFEQLDPNLQTHWEKKTKFLSARDDTLVDEATYYFERAAIYAEFGKVIVIGVGIFHPQDDGLGLRVKSFSHDHEGVLLKTFSDFLTSKFDQDHLRLCAHNGKEFDFPYLCRRFLVNGIDIPTTLNLSAKKPWEVNHIDTMELWKFGDRKNFTSLDLLTSIFRIPSSKSQMDGAQVNRCYYHEEDGLAKIADYCKEDVIATAQLFLRLNNEALIPEERITIIP